MFTTPILFLVFNRPDTTKIVFEKIRKIKPSFLYLAADGPRNDKQGEKEICDNVRNIVLSNIDWECEVKTLFRNENLGCGKAVSQAITWFFEHVEEGIILEDDCLPDSSFFKYCEVMLVRYRNNEQIMHIGGNNFQFGTQRGMGDYYFSILGHIWGWATWRRSWIKYNFILAKNYSIDNAALAHAFNNNELFIDYWKGIFIMMANNEIDTWDYQWSFTIINNNGMAICPNVNLVSNIGFGRNATHTRNEPIWNNLNPKKSLHSYKEPLSINIDYAADSYTMQEIFGIKEKHKIQTGKIGVFLTLTKIGKLLFKRLRKSKLKE